MKENYSYPLNPEWTTEEIIKVMQLWEVLEKVYENKVTAEEFNDAYRSFKEVVRSIGEERQLGNEYEELTGYSLYRVAKLSRNQKTGPINKKELI
ncbi:UPF0223 family protein [Vagococcus silagei]|uniref:UPF0223 family protein n=1 Tax=Vagococcus silagei TaxID=2508885 RepID=A0A4S3B4S7_9ENTE|nr:UPF0223 family protein [Vagococcus silagei]THB61498.1 UPF0223 family protein [Vagococcus silagei]